MNRSRFLRNWKLIDLEQRINPAGQLDPLFGNGGLVTTRLTIPSHDEVRATAVDSQGRILVAGTRVVYSPSTNFSFIVNRYLASGALDESFGDNGIALAYTQPFAAMTDIAVDSLDRVVISGNKTSGLSSDCLVIRLKSTGVVDTDFGIKLFNFGVSYSEAHAIEVDSKDRIVVAGYAGSNSDFAVARLTPEGGLDPSFDNDGKKIIELGTTESEARCLAIDSFDRVVLGGYLADKTQDKIAVVRLNEDGALDNTFDNDGMLTFTLGSSDSAAAGLAIDLDNRIVVSVASPVLDFATAVNVLRFNESGSLDVGFGEAGIAKATYGANLHIYDLALDSQQRIVVSGEVYIDGILQWTSAITRFTSNGIADSTLDSDGKLIIDWFLGNQQNSVAIDQLDRIVFAGTIDLGLKEDFAIARLNSDGSYDSSFADQGKTSTDLGTGSMDYAYATARDSLDRMLVAGVTHDGKSNNFVVCRFTPDGQLDKTFGGTGTVTVDFGNTNDQAFGVAVDGMGRIVVAGKTAVNTEFDIAVARLTSTGQLDPTFDGDGKRIISLGKVNEAVSSVAVDSLMRIVIAGGATVGSTFDAFAVRLTSAGALDLTFDTDGIKTIAAGTGLDIANDVVIDSKNRIVLAGGATSGSDRDFLVVRLTETGTLDSSFDTDGKLTIPFGPSFDEANGVTIDSMGRIVVGGYASIGTKVVFAVARIDDTGTLDPTFDLDGQQTIEFGGSDRSYGLAIDATDRIVLAGTTKSTHNSIAVARLSSTGTLDTSFNGDGKATIDLDVALGVEIDSKGRVIVAGYHFDASDYDIAVARLTADGELDISFDTDGRMDLELASNSDAQSRAVAIDGLGRIIVGGRSVNGDIDVFSIVRYLPNGKVDETFGYSGSVRLDNSLLSSGTVVGLAVDSANRIVVAGNDQSEPSSNILVARLTADGMLDNTFSNGVKHVNVPGAYEDVAGVAIDSAGRIVLGGTIQNGANYDFAVVRLDINGNFDPSFDLDGIKIFDVNGTDYLKAVAIDSMDRVVVVGSTGTELIRDFAICRLTTTGELDSSFAGNGKLIIDMGTNEDVAYSVTIDSQNRIVAGGYVRPSSKYDTAICRILSTGVLDSSFDADGKQVISFTSFHDVARAVAVDSIDRVVVAGYLETSAGNEFAVARLTITGALDSDFDVDGKQTISFGAQSSIAYGLAVDAFDRPVVAGIASFYIDEFAVCRLTGDKAPTKVVSIQINDGVQQRSMVTSLTVTFDTPVTLGSNPSAAFSLVNQMTSKSAILSVALDATNTVVTVTFVGGSVDLGGSLADGRYTLTIMADNVNGGFFDGNGDALAGDNFELFGTPANGLFRLFGDVDANGSVSASDFNAFRLAYGTTGPSIFDFDGDDHVAASDFNQFRFRYGVTI